MLTPTATIIDLSNTTYTVTAEENGTLKLVPKPKKKIVRRSDYMAIGAELRRNREESGMSAEELAGKMRISKGYLYRIEGGYDCPVRRLRQAYRIMNREFVIYFMEA